MFEKPFDEDALPSEEEIATETDAFLEREVISYHRITDAEYGIAWMLYPVVSAERREVAAKIARYFHRETRFDFAPYTEGDENEDRVVYLVRSKRITTMVPIIAGAVEFQKVGDKWVLTWIWLHPWERSTRLATAVFDLLDSAFGAFLIEGPISGAMRRLMEKRQYELSRVVRIARS